MGNTASRSVGVDTVRVIAIVAIVAGHAWTRDRSALVVYPWHVPLFFILSGYLWSGRRSLDQEARRRLETLGRPYLFWLLVLIASTLIVLGPEARDRVIGALRGGAEALQPFTTFWFVSALLVTVLCSRSCSTHRHGSAGPSRLWELASDG